MLKKTILVTGASGFIGANLVDRLLNEGHKVIGIDNNFTGNLENLKRAFNDFAPIYEFGFLEHNIIEPLTTEMISNKMSEHIKLDEIYNLACPASPPHYQIDPIYTFKTSVIGTMNMLELAKEHGATLLQASTSEVYGDPQVHPQTEKYWGNVNPIGIRSCYDEGKRAAETLCMDYHKFHKVDVRIIRIFNTYGPGMNPTDGRVVSNFICQALQGKDITIYGDGSQTRSFQYVTDLIEGMTRMMASNCVGPINLGNPNEFTIKELADKVVEMVPTDSKVIYEPLPGDDPQVRKPDINKACNELGGWEPKIQLEEGLTGAISYFADKLGL